MTAHIIPPTHMSQATNKPVNHVTRALLGAALVLIIAAALRLAVPDYLSHDLSVRLTGVLLGLVIVANANNVPKAIPCRLPVSLHAAEAQSARRFVGWSLVLGGLGYITAWLVAPFGKANAIATVLLATTLAVAMGRVMIGRSRSGH